MMENKLIGSKISQCDMNQIDRYLNSIDDPSSSHMALRTKRPSDGGMGEMKRQALGDLTAKLKNSHFQVTFIYSSSINGI